MLYRFAGRTPVGRSVKPATVYLCMYLLFIYGRKEGWVWGLERGGAHTAGALCIRAIVLTWRVDLLVSDCECFLFFECFDEYEQKLVDTQKFVEYCKTILMSTTLSCLQFTFTSHAHAYASVGFAPVYKHSVGDRLKLTIGFVFSLFFLTFPLFFCFIKETICQLLGAR